MCQKKLYFVKKKVIFWLKKVRFLIEIGNFFGLLYFCQFYFYLIYFGSYVISIIFYTLNFRVLWV